MPGPAPLAAEPAEGGVRGFLAEIGEGAFFLSGEGAPGEPLLVWAAGIFLAGAAVAAGFFFMIMTTTMIDTIVFQTLHNPSIPKILTSLMGLAEDDGDILRRLKRFGSVSNSEARMRKRQRSRPCRRASPQMMSTNGVFQLDTVFCASVDRFTPPTMLPHEIATLTYGELVCFAVKAGCILLGLRRSVNTVDLGQHMVGTPFLATNPPTDTQLVSSDEVYFLYIESPEPMP